MKMDILHFHQHFGNNHPINFRSPFAMNSTQKWKLMNHYAIFTHFIYICHWAKYNKHNYQLLRRYGLKQSYIEKYSIEGINKIDWVKLQ